MVEAPRVFTFRFFPTVSFCPVSDWLHGCPSFFLPFRLYYLLNLLGPPCRPHTLRARMRWNYHDQLRCRFHTFSRFFFGVRRSFLIAFFSIFASHLLHFLYSNRLSGHCVDAIVCRGTIPSASFSLYPWYIFGFPLMVMPLSRFCPPWHSSPTLLSFFSPTRISDPK